MRKNIWSLLLCMGVVVALTGCPSTTPPEDLQPVPEASTDPSGMGGGFGNSAGLDSTSGGGFGGGPGADGKWVKGADNVGGADADGWVIADPSGNRLGMPIIYFKYDSDVLVAKEAEKLDTIAEYLDANPVLGLLIEGHCDQRGTDEYNRALGERRANAVRAYLANRGLADNRIKTISYGKDKPAVEGSGEEVWRKNRRGVPVPMKMPTR